MSKDSDFMKEVRDNYKESVTGWRHIYDEASNDLKFVYDVDSGQWPDSIRKDREKDGRPILTVNKLQKFVRQLRGDQMMNRPRIKVIPVDDKSDVRIAELYNGLIRQIEYLSTASAAYDTAYMHAISCSVGFFRLITQYSNDNSFNQDIFIKRIINPFSVHYEPYASEFEYEDARYCFIEDLMDKSEYKRKYGKDNMVDFESTSAATIFGDWLQQDKIRIAEYFYKDTVKKKIVMLETGEIIPIGNGITTKSIVEQGGRIARERDVDTHIVKWCKLNGIEPLEESDWPGKDIPIIPVFGDEIVADGKRYYLSLARGAKGPQQMYNYWATAATETVALAPKMPFLVDHRQIKGFEKEWEEANLTNRMYIRYNAVQGLNKPAREPQAQIPAAIMNMMQATAYDIEDHLGRYEASEGKASNERSGKAIIARVAQSDKGTYTFVDNLTRAIVCAGRQMIDLIPKIYDTPRALRIMGETGQEQLVNVNQPILDENGQVGIQNDLSVGEYDLIASVGASFSSKRQEMVEMLIQSMQYAPMLAPVIAPLIFKYSDYPGAEEVYQEIKKQADMMQQQQLAQQGGKPL